MFLKNGNQGQVEQHVGEYLFWLTETKNDTWSSLVFNDCTARVTNQKFLIETRYD